jgi:alkyl sulfatase BDS1-like metallo-beta-lactamase superfamily hydrolase
MTRKPLTLTLLLSLTLFAGGCTSAASGDTAADMEPKAATEATIQVNEAMQAMVENFNDQDFENASRGRIAELPDPIITGAEGNVVWDSRQWEFLQGEAPDTVNPSLWRMQKLNSEAGLFKVADGIYQFRGYDIANMILIQGDTGWIVVDSTLTAPVAAAGLKLAQDTLNDPRPVVAVIYTHSHSDHWGGIRGLVDEADLRSGKVKIYGPKEFMEYAVSENVLAGNAMSRRGQYQFGSTLTPGPQGIVGTGLGLGLSKDSPGLIAPTDDITKTGQRVTIDGVPIEFQMAMKTEAPASIMFYFPKQKALCVGEVVNQLMHNVYTIRGAEVRNSLVWSKTINETLDLFPDAKVAFGLHFWPVWGQDNVRTWLKTQRDTYRFIHDRALHLANNGQTMTEIGSAEFFPEALAAQASSRGYYGTLSHNLRAVYQAYLGFYDANPATLDPLPRTESAKKYVEAMGGEEAVIEAGRKAFEAGDYRWVVELVNNAVFANPDNAQARALQADALEQLGYQAESATWRNAYLMGAQELRDGIQPEERSTSNPDTMAGMTNEMLFDFISVSLDQEKTDGMQTAAQVTFTDLDETWALELENSVLNNTKGRKLANPDVTLTLTRPAFLAMVLGGQDVTELVQSGQITMKGDPTVFAAMLGSAVQFNPAFNVVTPPTGP